jgi:hypothetical protein
MNAGLPLPELMALLARQLAESATMAERRQRDDYVALAAEVEGSLESYIDRAIGGTEKDRRTAAARCLTDIALPILPILSILPKNLRLPNITDATMIGLDKAGCDRLIDLLGETIRDLFEAGSRAGTWYVEREKLERCVVEKLRRDAEKRYVDIRALLRAGVPRTQIRGGQLSAKLLLEENGSGTVLARLASTEATKGSGDVISTITIDFNVGAFPPFE